MRGLDPADSLVWQRVPLEDVDAEMPLPRSGSAMVGFSEHSKAMLFGGGGEEANSFGDTWLLELLPAVEASASAAD